MSQTVNMIHSGPFVVADTAAATCREHKFPGNVDFVRFQNDTALTLLVLGHDNTVLLHILPGDIIPWHAGAREYNSFRIVASAVSTAGDIAALNFLYMHYRLKIKGH